MLKIVMKCQYYRQAKSLFSSLYPKSSFRDDLAVRCTHSSLDPPQGSHWLWRMTEALSVSVAYLRSCRSSFFLACFEPISFCLAQTVVALVGETEVQVSQHWASLILSTSHARTMLFDFWGAGVWVRREQGNPPKIIWLIPVQKRNSLDILEVFVITKKISQACLTRSFVSYNKLCAHFRIDLFWYCPLVSSAVHRD